MNTYLLTEMPLLDDLANIILLLPKAYVWHTVLPAFLFACVFSKRAASFVIFILGIIFLMVFYMIIDSVLSYFIKPDYLWEIVTEFYLVYIAIFFILLRILIKKKRRYFKKKK